MVSFYHGYFVSQVIIHRFFALRGPMIVQHYVKDLPSYIQKALKSAGEGNAVVPLS